MKGQAFLSSDDAFSINFANGYLISVYYGNGSYSDNGDTTCEVACFDDKGKWMIYDFVTQFFTTVDTGNEIHARTSPEQLSEIMYKISKL
jgi:hypothetical protein